MNDASVLCCNCQVDEPAEMNEEKMLGHILYRCPVCNTTIELKKVDR